MTTRPVVLEWQGKAKATTALAFPPPALEVFECSDKTVEFRPTERDRCGGLTPGTPGGRLIHGDALDVAKRLAAGGLARKVDLVYLDPPFASNADYTHEERFEGPATGKIARTQAYRDRWDDGIASYLDMLYPRLLAMRELLHDASSIWIHVDWRANYLVRSLCDEIFGRERFLNEIIWRRAPNLGRQARSGQFGRTLDTLVVYGGGDRARLIPPDRLVPIGEKAARLDASGRYFTVAPRGDYTDTSIARLEAEGRVHRTAGGSVYVKYWLERDDAGRLCKRQPVDALWTDVAPLRHVSPRERTGYPTQKPRALLERILRASLPEGGLVVDLFAGSGTTGAAAMALGASFILGDASQVAIATARSRLLREGAHFRMERCGPSPCDAPRVRAEAERSGQGEVRVTLAAEPDHQPIAWAIDAAPTPGEPFRCTWHAERGLGRRPTELPHQATLPVARGVRALAVRVYFVDGATSEITAEICPAHPGRDLSQQPEGTPA